MGLLFFLKGMLGFQGGSFNEETKTVAVVHGTDDEAEKGAVAGDEVHLVHLRDKQAYLRTFARFYLIVKIRIHGELVRSFSQGGLAR